ncbi:hypothetical protein B5F25_12060 [Bacteroides sp. An19]|nr:hypothetical protein B5F25_12060 [Bacteroides sp. An19]
MQLRNLQLLGFNRLIIKTCMLLQTSNGKLTASCNFATGGKRKARERAWLQTLFFCNLFCNRIL